MSPRPTYQHLGMKRPSSNKQRGRQFRMASPTRGQIFFSDKVADALVAYLIKSDKSVSSKTLGRTILQKLCYFAEASGVPLPFRFEIYHYGPFSQEIFDRAESLLLDS